MTMSLQHQNAELMNNELVQWNLPFYFNYKHNTGLVP